MEYEKHTILGATIVIRDKETEEEICRGEGMTVEVKECDFDPTGL